VKLRENGASATLENSHAKVKWAAVSGLSIMLVRGTAQSTFPAHVQAQTAAVIGTVAGRESGEAGQRVISA
jgi:hypothetical protein